MCFKVFVIRCDAMHQIEIANRSDRYHQMIPVFRSLPIFPDSGLGLFVLYMDEQICFFKSEMIESRRQFSAFSEWKGIDFKIFLYQKRVC